MKDYVEENERILTKWQERQGYTDEEFAPDGIMYKEVITGNENEIWANASCRYLFITKDQNSRGARSWDVREEIGRKTENAESISSLFYRNLMYQLYGIAYTTKDGVCDWDDFTKRDAIDFFDNCPLARINVKKKVGNNSIDNNTLKKFIDKDSDFLKQQILNLDADIIFCCGFSESICDTGNLILNFLIKNCYPELKKISGWIYYDEINNKVAINNWHLTARKSSKMIFENMMKEYHDFLIFHPDFLEKIRASR